MFAVQEASASVRSISLALWRRVVRSTSYVYNGSQTVQPHLAQWQTL
jgi:hypothetical protein